MITVKDVLKLVAVMALSFCMVFILSVFTNYLFDLKDIAPMVSGPQMQAVYDAKVTVGNLTLAAAGGILGLITLVVLLFSIGSFIRQNSANMGTLKALGYSSNRIAAEFVKFGLSVFAGSVLGYLIAYAASPLFYDVLKSGLPDAFQFGFHIETLLLVILAPGVLFSALSILYARLRLRKQPLELINGMERQPHVKVKEGKSDRPFLKELKRTMLIRNIALIFFTGFAAFAFSAQVQLSFSMHKLMEDAAFITVILVVMGLALGFTTLFLAFSFIFNSNGKYIAILKAYGYTQNECGESMFGGYRMVSYIGFGVGSGYQFLLVKLLASLFAGTSGLVIEIGFDLIGFFVSLAVFVVAFEALMLYYKQRIAKLPFKQIMQ